MRVAKVVIKESDMKGMGYGRITFKTHTENTDRININSLVAFGVGSTEKRFCSLISNSGTEHFSLV